MVTELVKVRLFSNFTECNSFRERLPRQQIQIFTQLRQQSVNRLFSIIVYTTSSCGLHLNSFECLVLSSVWCCDTVRYSISFVFLVLRKSNIFLLLENKKHWSSSQLGSRVFGSFTNISKLTCFLLWKSNIFKSSLEFPYLWFFSP